MLLTATEVAELLQVSEDRVRLWTKTGELQAINLSRRMTSKKPVLRFRDRDVDEFLESRLQKSDVRTPRRTSRLSKEWRDRARAVGLKID